MNTDSLTEKYYQYQENKNCADNITWSFGNSILYNMCEENPKHSDIDIIASKLMLIGRSYAASVERGKWADEYVGMDSDSFYYKGVAPILCSISSRLDDTIQTLNNSNSSILQDLETILSIHQKLIDCFLKVVPNKRNRSFASKYLHFHCPNKFFIYDLRACSTVNKNIPTLDKSILPKEIHYDREYANFVCRMITLQNALELSFGKKMSPRELDDFLLYEFRKNQTHD